MRVRGTAAATAFVTFAAMMLGACDEPDPGGLRTRPQADVGDGGVAVYSVDASADAAPPPPPQTPSFDYAVFATKIQPILDKAENKGCSAAACHAAGVAGFTLKPSAPKDSAESKANYAAVTALCDLTGAPDATTLVKRGSEPKHAGGQSVVYSAADKATITDWIQRAKENTGKGKEGCKVQPSAFNVGVFRAEILPILTGKVDLNNPGLTKTSCASSECHGKDRPDAAHALVLEATLSDEENLANFACQVNLDSPSTSAILACPTNAPSCTKPHPGGPIWQLGNADHNYQRVLSWLFAAKGAKTPLDFAYFVRNIEPMFDDVTLGAAPRSCSSNQGCHGVAAASQLPPNKSNFPIIANPGDRATHWANFSSTLNFINFIEPSGSALYLFPTDEVRKKAEAGNYFLGLPHGGGTVIQADSVQAKAIQRFARGLRLETNGTESHWLLAGDYPNVNNPTDATPLDEKNVIPNIFEVAAGAQNADRTWDQLSGTAGAPIDLLTRFPARAQSRAVYAAAYLLNTASSDRAVQLKVTSSNPLLVYAEKTQVAMSNGGNAGALADTLGTATLKGRASTRILLKVVQRTGDTSFGFTLQVLDTNGAPLPDDGQLIVKLSPDGGI